MTYSNPTRTNSNLTATECLRELLDERGVEWGNVRRDGSTSKYLTEWQFEDNQGKAIAIEWSVGSGLSVEIRRYHLTPEQAIAATLGAGTCKADETDTMECVCDGIGHYGEPLTVHVMECSACGRTYEYVNGGYEFCPRCGAKVVVE